MRLFVCCLLLAVACSSGPTDPGNGPEAVTIDSLYKVGDSLCVELGRQRCLVECLRDTLLAHGIEPVCQCPY